MIAAPSRFNLLDEGHVWLLAKATEQDREELRAVARSGPAKDRVMAAIVLTRLGDDAAGAVLAGLLAEPACLRDAVLSIEMVGAAAFRAHAQTLTPWLLGLLDSADVETRRCAASACGRLRIAAAGPRLLRLARTTAEAVLTGREHSWDPQSYLASAAEAWPSREVADEVRRWLDLQPALGTDLPGGEYRPADAVAQLAQHAEAGVYEWALQWCAQALSAGHTAMAAALTARGAESVPLLVQVIRESPHEHAAGRALEELACLDPALADRFAREDWPRFPREAIQVLADRHRGTAADDVVDLVVRIGIHLLDEEDECVEALVRIGGPRASAAAAQAVERIAERDPYDPELERLRTLVASGSEPRSALAVLVDVFAWTGQLVSFDPESGQSPPPYDELVTRFVDASLGAVRVEAVELVERAGGVRLSLTQHGTVRTWDIQDSGDWYDLYTVWEIADSLTPGGGDPRRFVQIGQSDYAFVEPGRLSEFCERNGIELFGEGHGA